MRCLWQVTLKLGKLLNDVGPLIHTVRTTKKAATNMIEANASLLLMLSFY